MVHKSLIWSGLIVFWLTTSAYTSQEQPVGNSRNGWLGLGVAFVIIIILAILLILQTRNTPQSTAKYHLDHAVHEDEPSHTADQPVEPAVAAAVDTSILEAALPVD